MKMWHWGGKKCKKCVRKTQPPSYRRLPRSLLLSSLLLRFRGARSLLRDWLRFLMGLSRPLTPIPLRRSSSPRQGLLSLLSCKNNWQVQQNKSISSQSYIRSEKRSLKTYTYRKISVYQFKMYMFCDTWTQKKKILINNTERFKKSILVISWLRFLLSLSTFFLAPPFPLFSSFRELLPANIMVKILIHVHILCFLKNFCLLDTL